MPKKEGPPLHLVRGRGGKPVRTIPLIDLSITGEGQPTPAAPTTPNTPIDAEQLLRDVRQIARLPRRKPRLSDFGKHRAY